jgi:NADH-quinone oxidoreductase subunit C
MASRYEALADDEATTPEATPERELTTLERLAAQFGDKILLTSTRLGEATATVDPKSILDIMLWLRDEEKFVLCSDVTAHDCHGEEPRFWVVYHLTNVERPDRLRIKAGLPEKKPVIESVVPIWPGANFFEREVYDLFGVIFQNHPNLKRIMMPQDWEGHPLRKDFPVVYEPVQFTHNFRAIEESKPYAEE